MRVQISVIRQLPRMFISREATIASVASGISS